MKESSKVMSFSALFATCMFGAGACQPAADTSIATTEDGIAMRAASPACAAARDACKAQAQPFFDAINAACSGIGMACGIAPHQSSPDGSASNPDAGTSCADARNACAAAVATAKPQLQMVGQTCGAQIHAACAPSVRVDGGVPAADGGLGHAGDGGAMVGGDAGAGANSCKNALQSCHGQLGAIRAMPPADCAAAQTACSGQGLLTSSDQCRMAATACQSALQATLKTTLDACSSQISTSCGHHGG